MQIIFESTEKKLYSEVDEHCYKILTLKLMIEAFLLH